jgi:metallo-beta-lactamase family protein
MKLTFHGGAGAVTGANYLLEIDDPKKQGGVLRILIDCGLAQGAHFVERHNYDPFSYDLKTIDAVFVTHAHIDHTGRLPKLMKEGFEGTVYSTPPTRDCAELLLLDSQHILESEAYRIKMAPLYRTEDISRLMQHWRSVVYHQPIDLGAAKVTFYSAGHILGSASILIEAEGKRIIFSGDLGNQPAPLIGPGECPAPADYCVMESAYGDRNHEDLQNRYEKLERVILSTVKSGGALMIPAFALERTQILLLELHQMLEKHQIPAVPIFIDSPLAIKLTAVYGLYHDYLRPEVVGHFNHGDLFRFPGLRMTPTPEDSKSINRAPNPKIIIAGSGMSHAGRILHHELRYLSDPKSTLLIFGYQVSGSLGRRLLEGEKQISIMGTPIHVRATIKAIGGYSAHADQRQLIEWARPLASSVKQIFLVQGEGAAPNVLAAKLREELSVNASVPTAGESVVL